MQTRVDLIKLFTAAINSVQSNLEYLSVGPYQTQPELSPLSDTFTFQALPTNIGLWPKLLSVTNALAYDSKTFYHPKRRRRSYKTFFLVTDILDKKGCIDNTKLTNGPNKLACH
jgi:hypothetical protein